MPLDIPTVIWSALIASGITLFGVALSNRSNTKRQALQLQHDSNERSLERKAALRRELYAKAVEEMQRVHVHLASLPQLDLTQVNIGDGFGELLSAAARIQLVAEPETVSAVNHLMYEYTQLLFGLFERLVPISAAKIDSDSYERECSNARAEMQRIEKEFVQSIESGRADTVVVAGLRQGLAFYQTRHTENAERRDVALRIHTKLANEFQQHLFDAFVDMTGRQIPVLVALRRDLGILGDLDSLERETAIQAENLREKMRQLTVLLADS